MLVLTRKTQEQITIGDNIVISILKLKGNAVRIGIEAPKEIRVMRAELPSFDEPLASETSEAPTTELAATPADSSAAEQAEEDATVSDLEWEVLQKIAGRRKCGPTSRRCSPKPHGTAPLASIVHREATFAIGE